VGLAAALLAACAGRPGPAPLAAPGGAVAAVERAPRDYPDCVLHRLARLAAQDRRRDRAVAPRDADVDRSATLAALLAPGDDAGRFDPARAAEVEGWVVAVHVGGVEGINCLGRRAGERDTHIDLAAAPGAPDTARVVVEVTPRWRAAMRDAGVDWSTAALRAALLGRRVRVRGWLFYDAHHADESARHDPGDRRDGANWRATAWEVHPVTAVTVLR
jgi:hypothetical protein